MPDHETWMRRCLQLAALGADSVAPNPMVGAVLVHDGEVLAEGWHRSYGGPHAEVECLRALGDGPIPDNALLYVNLEPCAHYGKTPPCADLIIARRIKRVIVGCTDPAPHVQGKGIVKLRAAGVDVEVDVLRDECRWLNRRFIHRFEEGRPYVILKWAQSADGFLDDHGKSVRISCPSTDVIVHRWRSEEQAILVGGRTVINDDPQLTVRHVEGRSPIRIVLDRARRTSPMARVFDRSAPTVLVTELLDGPHDAHVVLHAGDGTLELSIEMLLRKELSFDVYMAQFGLPPISSVLVEGGAMVLNAFISSGLWDEARVITGTAQFGAGTPAPSMLEQPLHTARSGVDRIDLFTNGARPFASWDW